MVAASVSQIRANDVTNPLCRWLYNMLWIATVTVQLFCRSIGALGRHCRGDTKQALYLAALEETGVHWFRRGCEVAWRMPRGSFPRKSSCKTLVANDDNYALAA
jgi:hypothetical protein